ncbi:MAG TPA: Gfo/Idh/MocA family oxidoreductase [Candidatus Hydrogenedentes bacterium]|nr:Gfo/Idh/MocA family oxidoreductase [Candidatus Hydrogenedentota bacterium]
MKTKWGVLGAGGIARRRTIPEGIVCAENCALTAVYDVDAQANAEVAAQFGATACANEEELLASDVDIVYVATPAWLHCDQVLRAAAAGKHVFCEKPLGMTVEESMRMIEACAKAGVKLGVGFMMRFHAQHQAALQLVREGRLGKMVFGRAQLSCWYPPIPGAWRQTPEQGGGGSLMDLGGHCIDLLELFLGRAKSVQCVTDRLAHDYASEDTAVALLEFSSGAKGVVDCLFNVPDASSLNRLELYGTRGSVLAEGTIGQGESGTMTARLESDAGDYAAQQQRDTGGGVALNPTPVNMYRAEVEAFAKAVIENTEPPVNDAEGLWSQKVLAACYESAKTGRKVLLD